MASEEEMMRQMMGFSGFGTKAPTKEKILHEKLDEAKRVEKRVVNKDDSEDDDEVIGPLPPPPVTSSEKEVINTNEEPDSDEDTDEDEEEKEMTPIQKGPLSHEISLGHGTKVISALALDPSGSRLATGSHDYDVKFWDFNSMDINLRPFRTLTPAEGHWINSLAYTPTGDMLVIGAGNAQPQVLDRDGHQVYECKKGDQYIFDMKNTKGHVSMVRNCCWDPKDRNLFLSCGDDSSVRIWDINIKKKNKHVITMKNKQNKKTIVTYALYNRDGKLIVATGGGGSLQAWDTRKMFVNTCFKNMQAHAVGSETSCISISADERAIVTRGGDDTVKQWDMRNINKPVAVAQDLISYYSTTKCLFSPDDKLILTGTSVKKGQGNGKLVFLERETLKSVHELQFEDTCVVSALWHHKINQILVGLSNGNVKVLFDPKKSNKGATLCVGKVKSKRIDPGEGLARPQIINPISLRMYREKKAETMKKIKMKQRADPVASHKPDAPLGLSNGVGGRIKEGMSLTGFVIKNIALAKADTMNPREALLKHAEAAAKDPYWVAPAYAQTQPKPIWTTKRDSDNSDGEEEGELLPPREKKVKNTL